MLRYEVDRLKPGDLVMDTRTGYIFKFIELVEIGLDLKTFTFSRKRYFLSCESIEGETYSKLTKLGERWELPLRSTAFYKSSNTL